MGDVTLAGLTLTADEWRSFEECDRMALLALIIESAPPSVDDNLYELYELSLAGPGSWTSHARPRPVE